MFDQNRACRRGVRGRPSSSCRAGRRRTAPAWSRQMRCDVPQGEIDRRPRRRGPAGAARRWCCRRRRQIIRIALPKAALRQNVAGAEVDRSSRFLDEFRRGRPAFGALGLAFGEMAGAEGRHQADRLHRQAPRVEAGGDAAAAGAGAGGAEDLVRPLHGCDGADRGGGLSCRRRPEMLVSRPLWQPGRMLPPLRIRPGYVQCGPGPSRSRGRFCRSSAGRRSRRSRARCTTISAASAIMFRLGRLARPPGVPLRDVVADRRASRRAARSGPAVACSRRRPREPVHKHGRCRGFRREAAFQSPLAAGRSRLPRNPARSKTP